MNVVSMTTLHFLRIPFLLTLVIYAIVYAYQYGRNH